MSSQVTAAAGSWRKAFAPPTATPAGTRTYDVLRLRADKVSQPEARRPGANFRLVEPTAGVLRARGVGSCPTGCACDELSMCGTPYLPPKVKV